MISNNLRRVPEVFLIKLQLFNGNIFLYSFIYLCNNQ